MLRAVLLYLSQAAWARKIVTSWSIAWRVASRFVAGETLEEAVAVVKKLNEAGMVATLDHLGEYTSTPEEARMATEEAAEILDVIYEQKLRSGLSVKLTQLGLLIDEQLCLENLGFLLGKAVEYGIFVRIDMEDSPLVDVTFRIFDRLTAEVSNQNLGMVIQSYLYRSEADTKALLESGVRVRLVKGAYKEPADVAYPRKADVDGNFDRLTDILIAGALAHGSPALSGDGRFPPIPAIASQDEARIEYARKAAEEAGLPQQAIEFQMLYGIRRDLQDELVKSGYPVRIYVPFGKEWYPYFVRRLAERPANLWFFLSNLLKR